MKYLAICFVLLMVWVIQLALIGAAIYCDITGKKADDFGFGAGMFALFITLPVSGMCLRACGVTWED